MGGIRITPRFTVAQIKDLVSSKMVSIEQAAISRLQFVGEKFVTAARNNGDYKDHTGNLRSSVGYVILKDGVQLFENFNTFPAADPEAVGESGKGIETAQVLIEQTAQDLTSKYPRGLILICVAGMDYAAAVESKGYDVITSSSIVADADLKSGFAALNSKIGAL